MKYLRVGIAKLFKHRGYYDCGKYLFVYLESNLSVQVLVCTLEKLL